MDELKLKKISIINNTINSYTDYIEKTYMSNTKIAGSCFGYVFSIITISCTLFGLTQNQQIASSDYLFLIIAVMLMMIPVILAYFLYTFSFNGRKVAFYRGYVQYLERCLNELLESNEFCYTENINNQFMTKYVKKFYNQPVALAVYVVLVDVVAVYICYQNISLIENSLIHNGIIVLGVVTLVVCIIVSSCYLYNLAHNDKVLHEVYERLCNGYNI